jgi:hypothetical protein
VVVARSEVGVDRVCRVIKSEGGKAVAAIEVGGKLTDFVREVDF